jgi:hypothetical protein
MEFLIWGIVTTSIIYLYFKGKRLPDDVDSKGTQTETLPRNPDVTTQGSQTETFPESPSVMSEDSSSNFLGFDIESDIDSFFYGQPTRT